MSDGVTLVGLDFESFYDTKNDYSLRVLDIPSYILDPRFEPTMVAVKINSERPFPVDGPDIPKLWPWLGDPSKITLYGHNLQFDASMASWIWGWSPGMLVCTLSLARQTIQRYLRSLSLDSVARFLGLPPKGTTIEKVDGLRRADIIARGFWSEYLAYACLDIELSHGILMKLIEQVSSTELLAADVAIRMATEPSLILDQPMLSQYHNDVVRRKETMVASALAGLQDADGNALTKADLMSNDKFALVLESLGVEPPTKISVTTNEETWAFAKSDDGMKELEDHDDPVVQAVVAARLGVKSTMEETRAFRFSRIASLRFPARGVTGLFPVPLKVSGAHTHRFSGDWKLNPQNMKRNVPRLGAAGNSALRWSVCAPEGHKIIVADKKQIEARTAATFCGQDDLVEMFRTGQDPYCDMGSTIFGFPVTKANEAERFVGKQLTLGGIYGIGHRKYKNSIPHLAREQAGLEISISEQEAQRQILVYRAKTQKITNMRDYLNAYVIPMMTRQDTDFMLGPVRVMFERIILPGGLSLYYNNLRWAQNPRTLEWGWIYDFRQRIKRLYGGKLLENIIQALAQANIKQDMARLRPLFMPYGIRMALQAHDELLVVAPDINVEYARHTLREEMRRQWDAMPTLPIDVDISEPCERYGAAK